MCEPEVIKVFASQQEINKSLLEAIRAQNQVIAKLITLVENLTKLQIK